VQETRGPTFELDFLAPRKHKDRQFSLRALIAVKTFTQDTADGTPIVTAGCASFEVFDGAVGALIKELKSIRRKAKRRFEKHEKDSAKSKKK